MKDGFIRVGTASPALRVADCTYNKDAHIAAAEAAAARGVKVLLFPELSLTTATAGDLFYSPLLARAAEEALALYIRDTEELDLVSFLGLPVAVGTTVYNCTAAVSRGELLGLVAKCYPAETLDERAFSPAPEEPLTVSLADFTVPLGSELLFEAIGMPSLRIGVELGSDAAALLPPSLGLAAAGATLILNPSATPSLIGAAEERKLLLRALSRRTGVSYLHVNAGRGESGTDHVFGGESLLFSRGKLLAEGTSFSDISASGVIDTEAILSLRRRVKATADTTLPTVPFLLRVTETAIDFCLSPTPFVPKCEKERAARCEQILTIQARGLAGRLVRAHSKKAVIGISGGA